MSNAPAHNSTAGENSVIARETEVLIVGGGPVGLVLAHALGAQGVPTLIIERRHRPPEQSMAIGITPPSLEILRDLGLEREFLERGVKICRAWVHEDGAVLGVVDFGESAASFPFILSLPQAETVRILEDALKQRPSVRLHRGAEFVDLEKLETGLEARVKMGTTHHRVRAQWVVACDGHRSTVRQALGLPVKVRRYRVRFLMADFLDRTGWGADARVFFGPDGAVESFPLPGQLRRWIVQLPANAPPPDDEELPRQVRERTGEDLRGCQQTPMTLFQPKRAEAARFFWGRVVFCGDSAHVMSPIGGQGMNVGFADAASLAKLMAAGGSDEATLPGWERARRRAFRVAASGAATGMWIGTRRGRWGSIGRRWFISRILFHPTIKPTLASWFTRISAVGRRSTGVEQMDRADCCTDRLLRTVDQFTSINRCFSRYRTIFERWLFPEMTRLKGAKLHLVDLGAGGCDIAVWALAEAKKRGIALRVTAVDVDARITSHAAAQHKEVDGLTVRTMDARQLKWLEPIDYVFANHFLHHLDDETAVEVLRLIGRLARRGAVVSDLRRSWLSQAGFGVVAWACYRRSFAFSDGLLSVRKGFLAHELIGLAARAGLKGRASVETLVPGRLVLRISGGQEVVAFAPETLERQRNAEWLFERPTPNAKSQTPKDFPH